MKSLRSLLAFVAACLIFMIGGLVQRLVVFPLVKLRPERRITIVRAFMRRTSEVLFRALTLGGARMERPDPLPTGEASLLLMNHQSLLDVPTAVLMSDPLPPLFVTRRRYARFVPIISVGLRLNDSPVIEPMNRRESLDILRGVARDLDRGVLIFPEGRRTEDGEVRAFRTAGAEVMLEERPMPVYLVVTDGFWSCSKLGDFLFKIHEIRGRTEVLGPFRMAEGETAVPFLERMRQTMVDHLATMRAAASPNA
jgi:1-acyl-sn-glycerol-3-phosphate acyltransferase